MATKIGAALYVRLVFLSFPPLTHSAEGAEEVRRVAELLAAHFVTDSIEPSEAEASNLAN